MRDRSTLEHSTFQGKAAAMRVVGIEVMLSGVMMLIIGGSIFALIYLDTQPGYVFILPGALVLAGLFYSFKGLTYLISP